MRLLLDTCVLLWRVSNPGQLSTLAKEKLVADDVELYVSAITAFEIAVKHRKGKLVLPICPGEWFRQAVAAYSLNELPVTSEIATMAPLVDVPHADPCDRMIVATAQVHGIAVVTPDHLISACKDIQIVW